MAGTAKKKPRKQVGALLFRTTASGIVEFMLITSRDTGRWIIPKGWPMKGKRDSTAAAREAWEEAGITGTIGRKCIGTYEYEKALSPSQSLRCQVRVYPLEVLMGDSAWPEFGQRKRRWFSREEAAAAVAEPELAGLILAFIAG